MKKVFLYLLLIVLLGCRNEDVWVENIKYEEESRKFSVFTAQSPNDTIDYAKGFEILAKRYDSLYQENFTRNLVLDTLGKKKILGYINFNIRTKVFTNEEGDKWVVFPKIGQNKVINLYLALLQNNEREVYFYDIDNQSDFYKDHIEKFQMSYERFIIRKKSLLWKLKTFGKVEDEDGHEYIEAEPIPEKKIEEVVIVSPRFKGGGSNGVVVSFPNIVFPIFGGGCIVFDGCRGGGRNGGEHSSEPKKFNPDEEEVEDDLDPCGNNKKIASNSVVNAKNNDLKEKLKDIKKNKVKEKDIFEDGYTFDRYSNGDINPNVRENRQEGQSSMTVSIKSNTVGYNHTHPKGVKMFSPRDIDTFVSIVRNAKRNNIPYNELFATVVFERDGKYSVYQMTYTGDGSDLPAEFTEEQLKIITDKYAKDAKKYLEYGEGQMYIDDGYRLFLDTLKNMGVKNVQLSDVSNPQNPIIVEDNKGRPKKVNCK